MTYLTKWVSRANLFAYLDQNALAKGVYGLEVIGMVHNHHFTQLTHTVGKAYFARGDGFSLSASLSSQQHGLQGALAVWPEAANHSIILQRPGPAPG